MSARPEILSGIPDEDAGIFVRLVNTNVREHIGMTHFLSVICQKTHAMPHLGDKNSGDTEISDPEWAGPRPKGVNYQDLYQASVIRTHEDREFPHPR
jgi:hypothetical protein